MESATPQLHEARVPTQAPALMLPSSGGGPPAPGLGDAAPSVTGAGPAAAAVGDVTVPVGGHRSMLMLPPRPPGEEARNLGVSSRAAASVEPSAPVVSQQVTPNRSSASSRPSVDGDRIVYPLIPAPTRTTYNLEDPTAPPVVEVLSGGDAGGRRIIGTPGNWEWSEPAASSGKRQRQG